MTPQSRTEPATPSGEKRKEAQDLADRARGARRKTIALAFAQRALELDGECTDAQVVYAQEEAASAKDLASRLRIIVSRAEAKLGAPFLREHRGHLWDIPEARPCLRARMALALAHERSGKPVLAIPHLQDLLAIDAEDHLGARYRLVCCLLAVDDLKTLDSVLKRWEQEASAFMAWASLLARIRAKAGKDAERALHHARSVNPYVEEFLTGRRKLPKRLSAAIVPGSPEEAASALRLFGETWANDREGMYWLFKHG